MISLAIINALVAEGCTARQLAAAIRADAEDRARRRAERRAARIAAAAGKVLLDASGAAAFESRSAPEADSRVMFAPAQDAIPKGKKGPARVALLMSLTLRPAARLVGAQLVDHHNLETGRCDPSIERLAQLTKMTVRSVSRALGQLEKAGLVERLTHGSYGHRNAYRLNWTGLGAMASAAQARGEMMNEPDSQPNRTRESTEPDSGVRQTLIRKPDSSSGGSGENGPPLQRELPLLRTLPGGKLKGDGAYGAAGARLWQALSAHMKREGPAHTQQLAALITDQVNDQATLAEMRSPGSGLRTALQLVADGLERGESPAGLGKMVDGRSVEGKATG